MSSGPVDPFLLPCLCFIGAETKRRQILLVQVLWRTCWSRRPGSVGAIWRFWVVALMLRAEPRRNLWRASVISRSVTGSEAQMGSA